MKNFLDLIIIFTLKFLFLYNFYSKFTILRFFFVILKLKKSAFENNDSQIINVIKMRLKILKNPSKNLKQRDFCEAPKKYREINLFKLHYPRSLKLRDRKYKNNKGNTHKYTKRYRNTDADTQLEIHFKDTFCRYKEKDTRVKGMTSTV